MKHKKLSPFFLILMAVIFLALACTGLYFIGYLDIFIIFILIPAGILGTILCFFLSLASVLRLKKEGLPISMEKKAALIVSAVILGTVLLSVIALVIVFAMAIAYM